MQRAIGPRLRIVAAVGIPPAIVERPNVASQAVVADTETQKRLIETVAILVGGTPQETRREMDAKVVIIGALIQGAGIKLD